MNLVMIIAIGILLVTQCICMFYIYKMRERMKLYDHDFPILIVNSKECVEKINGIVRYLQEQENEAITKQLHSELSSKNIFTKA